MYDLTYLQQNYQTHLYDYRPYGCASSMFYVHLIKLLSPSDAAKNNLVSFTGSKVRVSYSEPFVLSQVISRFLRCYQGRVKGYVGNCRSHN